MRISNIAQKDGNKLRNEKQIEEWGEEEYSKFQGKKILFVFKGEEKRQAI